MFLSARRADSADRSAYGSFWFEPVGVQTATGMRVTADSAMRLSAVYACVRVRAESFAVLPFKLYQLRADGTRARVTDHWLYRLMAVRPNRFQTPFEWREMMQSHIDLRGNAYNEIVEDGRGGVSELMPLHPDRISIEMLDNGSYRYRYTDQFGRERIYRRDQLWHLRGLSSDGIAGMNPIALQRETIALGLGAQDYATRFFANDAKPTGGWIEHPTNFKDKTTRDTWRESWQESQSGKNRGKTAVLEFGMKYHEIGMSNKDSQFIESRQMSVSDIARMFRVPPHKIGDLSKATFSNIEQQAIEFVTDAMLPISERWESSIKCNLLGEDASFELDFDFARLLKGDQSARSTYYHNGILDGWLTRNEARDMEGRDPLDGLDKPLRPLNMAENSSAPAQPSTATETKPEAEPPADGDDTDARLVSLLQGNAARMARRIAAGNPPGADVLAAALCIPVAQASAVLSDLSQSQQPEALVTAALMQAALKGTP